MRRSNSGFIYTTALPPAVIGAIDAALDLIPGMDDERETLLENSNYLRNSLHQLGFETGQSSTQIIPVMIGTETEALDVSKWLEEHGFLITAIRPPTVPENSSRIRLSLSALHTRSHIDQLLDVLKKWQNRK